MLGRRRAFRLLSLPPAAWLALFFVAPLILVVAISFRPEPGPINFDDPWTLSLAQYERIFATPPYLRLLGTAILLALAVATGATVLASPIPYSLAFRARA